jgi:hypothetical protein
MPGRSSVRPQSTRFELGAPLTVQNFVNSCPAALLLVAFRPSQRQFAGSFLRAGIR